MKTGGFGYVRHGASAISDSSDATNDPSPINQLTRRAVTFSTALAVFIFPIRVASSKSDVGCRDVPSLPVAVMTMPDTLSKETESRTLDPPWEPGLNPASGSLEEEQIKAKKAAGVTVRKPLTEHQRNARVEYETVSGKLSH
jgi:hypothetical protein